MFADPRDELVARTQAKFDFYFFARLMMMERTGTKWLKAPHHALICKALNDVFEGRTKRLIINIPPRYSKTELAVIMWIAWCLGQVPDSEFIHASYSAELAETNSGKVLNVVSHHAYRSIFPGTQLKSTAQKHWRTTADGVLYSSGTYGTLTGFGAGKERESFGGAIIIDDPHKADEARSDVRRRAVLDWYQQTLQSRVNNRRTPIIVIMQRLHENDLAGWLLEGGSGEKWEHLCLPAIREDGSALWPEKHTLEELRVMEKAMPYMFAGQYMQTPSPLAGGIFKPDQIEIVPAVPVGKIEWCRGWDLAASEDGDFTAGVKLGKLPDGRLIIADVVRAKMGPDERDAAIKNVAARDRETGDVKIGLPQDPGQAGKTQKLHLARLLQGYRVSITPELGDKSIRAEPFAAQVNVGNVLMVRGAWNEALLTEMRLFPNGAYDDQIDALSRAYKELAFGAQKAFIAAPIIISSARPGPGG